MFPRVIKPLKTKSFFMFGARGVGKSTALKTLFSSQPVLWFDLLDPELEDKFTLYPNEFRDALSARKKQVEWVIVDEIQKCPKLLNIVQKFIVDEKLKFALTGSSARRLKQKGTNMLGGRAVTEHLFPLTHIELGPSFDLGNALMTGGLPEAVLSSSDEERHAFLRSYVLNYLKLEVQSEQWVRKLEPFRKFLPVAAQMNGHVINYTNIAKDVGVDTTTVQSYFDIFEDTLLGFRLPAFHRSVRKQQRKAPKFYLFDTGVKRALDRTFDIPLKPATSAYGEAFEHFVVLELTRLSHYRKNDYGYSYLCTKDDVEIDLVIDRPGKPTALVEIKSGDRVDERDVRSLVKFKKDFASSEFFLLSNDTLAKKMDGVRALHWREGIEIILG